MPLNIKMLLFIFTNKRRKMDTFTHKNNSKTKELDCRLVSTGYTAQVSWSAFPRNGIQGQGLIGGSRAAHRSQCKQVTHLPVHRRLPEHMFSKGFCGGGHRISETVLLNLIMEYHGGCGRVTFNFPTCFFLRTTRASVFFPACAPLFRQALRLVHCSAANSFSPGNFSYVHSGHLLYIF